MQAFPLFRFYWQQNSFPDFRVSKLLLFLKIYNPLTILKTQFMKQLSTNILLLAFSFLLATCARNPVTGKRQVVLVSEAQEIAMGQEADPQIVAQYGLYDDKALQAFITEKGKAMAAISHRPRQGYVESNVFYHPELKFQFNVPQSWKYQNSPQRVQMAPQDGQALMFLTLAPGKSLQEAGQTLVQQNNLQVIESRETTVNGLNALYILADVKTDPQQQQQQQQQQPPVRILSYLINDGGVIYLMLGASPANTFGNYSQYFSNTMQSFKKLTDLARINKKPERVRIKTITANTTLEQALRSYKMPEKRFEELAILNGMQRNTQLTKGMLIKIIDN